MYVYSRHVHYEFIHSKGTKLKRNRLSIVIKKIAVMFIAALLLGCENQADVQVVNLDKRIDARMLQLHQPTNPDALIPENFYFFGVDRRNKSFENVIKYTKLLQYLTQTTAYEFKLIYSPEGTSSEIALGEDIVQFAEVAVLGVDSASEKYGINLIVREDNKTVLLVPEDSNITHLDEVKESRLVQSSRGFSQQAFISRIKLKQQVVFVDSAHDCVAMIIRADADVCAIEESLVKNYLEKEKLRELVLPNVYSSHGIASNIYVDEEVIEKIQQALISYAEGSYSLVDQNGQDSVNEFGLMEQAH